MKRYGAGVVAALVVALIASRVSANEQKCTNPPSGGTCFCAEPFQQTGFTVSSSVFYNPNDTSTLQCTNEDAVANAALVSNGTVSVSTDSTALAALPAGHSIARFARVGNGDNATLGHWVVPALSFARISSRWYWWHSSDFTFKGESGCQNSKFARGFSSPARQVWNTDLDAGSNLHFLNSEGQFNPETGCCEGSVGGTGLNFSLMKGRWWMFEVVVVGRDTSTSAPHFDVLIYGRNITNNTPEQLLTQFSAGAPNRAPLTTPGNTVVNAFRGTGCGAGWQGFSHYMAMGWTTDAGQRIGPAAEVEGGGGPPPVQPPAAPQGGSVTPAGVGPGDEHLGYVLLFAAVLAALRRGRPRA